MLLLNQAKFLFQESNGNHYVADTLASTCAAAVSISPLVNKSHVHLGHEFVSLYILITAIMPSTKQSKAKHRHIETEYAMYSVHGPMQDLDLPESLKGLYKTVWEIKQRVLVDMAADRGAYIDQSQSFNVHMSDPNFGKLTSLHFYGWKVIFTPRLAERLCVVWQSALLHCPLLLLTLHLGWIHLSLPAVLHSHSCCWTVHLCWISLSMHAIMCFSWHPG